MVSLAACPAVRLLAQSVVATRVGDNVTVRGPGLGFIKGETLARLKDGRTVRVEVEMAVLPKPGERAAAETRQTFVVSYDLWEERFAVTQVVTPPKSISYQTTGSAEAWCLEQLAIPVGAIGPLAHDLPFWVRLGYRVLDADSPPATDGGDFSLRGLIDALSKRRKVDAALHAIEAGPFRLPR
jgi:hypothetical protein